MWGAVLHDVRRASPDANLRSFRALFAPLHGLTLGSQCITRSNRSSFPVPRPLLRISTRKAEYIPLIQLTGSPLLVNYPVINPDSRDRSHPIRTATNSGGEDANVEAHCRL